jgi:hypothetical protein
MNSDTGTLAEAGRLGGLYRCSDKVHNSFAFLNVISSYFLHCRSRTDEYPSVQAVLVPGCQKLGDSYCRLFI